MTILFDGNTAAQSVLNSVKTDLARLKRAPRLGILYPQENLNQKTFSRMKKKTGEQIGIQTELIIVPPDLNTEGVRALVRKTASRFDGLLIQLPLGDGIDKFDVINEIPYEKDVEGLTDRRVGELVQRDTELFSPVAMAVIHALDEALEKLGESIEPLSIVLVGNSFLVGRPLNLILSRKCESVVICNHRTAHLDEITRTADIIISGTGKSHLITPDMVSAGTIVIDAGYERSAQGQANGDLHPDTAGKSAFFTPVPGGIGPLTVAYIFRNLVMLAMEKEADR